VAVLAPGGAPDEFRIANDERSIRKLVRRLDREARGDDNELDRTIVAEYLLPSQQAERRLRAREAQLETAALLYREHVAWLRCFRGIDTTIAMTSSWSAARHRAVRESPRALAGVSRPRADSLTPAEIRLRVGGRRKS
jgi:hypothetical protein